MIVEQAKPIAVKLTEDTSWVRRAFYEVDKMQDIIINVLSQENDNTILVEVIPWMPGLSVASHDHQTWCVVVNINEVKSKVDWWRADNDSEIGFSNIAKVRQTKGYKGNVVALLPDNIYSVLNHGNKPSLSLHIYGHVLAKIERSEFYPINKVQRPCPQRVRRSVDLKKKYQYAET